MSTSNPNMDDDSSTSDILDMRNEEGWEDIEDDNITENFVSLLDERNFSDVSEMLIYCKDTYDFNIWQIQKQHSKKRCTYFVHHNADMLYRS